MEDVTDKVLKGVTDDMDKEKRDEIINANITAINEEAVRGTHYRSSVRPFFLGNQYFLIVNEIFRDVRLVGAPRQPSASSGATLTTGYGPGIRATFLFSGFMPTRRISQLPIRKRICPISLHTTSPCQLPE